MEKLPRQEFEPFNRKTGLQLSKVLVASLGMKAEQSCTARFTSNQTRFGETPAIEYLRCGISIVTNCLARLKTRNQAKQLLPGMEDWMFEAPIKPASQQRAILTFHHSFDEAVLENGPFNSEQFWLLFHRFNEFSRYGLIHRDCHAIQILPNGQLIFSNSTDLL